MGLRDASGSRGPNGDEADSARSRGRGQDSGSGLAPLATGFTIVGLASTGIGLLFLGSLIPKRDKAAREEARATPRAGDDMAELERKLTARLDAYVVEAESRLRTAAVRAADDEYQFQDAVRAAQQLLSTGETIGLTPSQRSSLLAAARVSRDKAERDFGVEDWIRRGYAAFADGKFALAAEYFGEAVEAPDAGLYDVSMYGDNRDALQRRLSGEAPPARIREPQREPDRSPMPAAAPPPAPRRQVSTRGDLAGVEAFSDRAASAAKAGRSEEALAVYEELVSRFHTDSDPVVAEHVADALFNAGRLCDELGRHDEAVAAFDRLLLHYRGSMDQRTQLDVARTLLGVAGSLGQLGRYEDEIGVYDRLIGHFSNEDDALSRETYAQTLYDKGLTLGQLGRYDDEVATYDDLVERFGNDAEPKIREYVARALYNKGVTYGQLGRREDERAIYDELISRFEVTTEPAVREVVGRAWHRRSAS